MYRGLKVTPGELEKKYPVNQNIFLLMPYTKAWDSLIAVADRHPKCVSAPTASLDEYVPVVPDELTNYYLSRAGVEAPDTAITRLVSLSAQKFVADIVHDALQFCKVRMCTHEQQHLEF